ncbi:branched-chain amino acid ABC transporter permease [Aminobacter sp. AP02]|uniref:branched-chain amino acid ABC transporter permease n=1 Tax=Aminobacter sp. AP02 TaxID=2135737 RepID=UPI000D6DAC0F|nr:branched-chain amino acid ABC transporter permease [Aminobacter sp. AP02]PWK76788.1 amino acid/amide ABC transporter membrane protein 1 (HAAT family) [Aminobacter sp. AP02]
MFTNAFLSGLTMGGTYALVAMGLTLQYGVSRIMNLAYGEFVIAACFAALILFTSMGISPLLALLVVAPAGFAVSWLIYRILLTPLVRRAPNRGALEVDSILATFGMLFIVQGIMLALFGGDYSSYSYFNTPVELLGTTIAANRLIVLAVALAVALAAWSFLMHTRSGTAMRAVAVDPVAAGLVAIDVRWAAAAAFALGGAIAATGGVLVSMFLTFNANIGVVFTMKALIVVIMGGVGNIAGALAAGLILGLAESFVATYVDPGLTIAVTYAIFLAVLLLRPNGLFGARAR